MAIASPTHVVTLSVWDTHRGESLIMQYWVAAGPFDSCEVMVYPLQEALAAHNEAVELVDRRESRHRVGRSPWEQLEIQFDT